VGIDDVRIPPEKTEIIEREACVAQINSNYRNGVITEGERYNSVIDTWQHVMTEVEEVTFGLSRDKDGFNPTMMADWARAETRAGAPARRHARLMAKPQKKITAAWRDHRVAGDPQLGSADRARVLHHARRPQGSVYCAQDRGRGLPHARLVDAAQDMIINEPTVAPSAACPWARSRTASVIEPLSDRCGPGGGRGRMHLISRRPSSRPVC
jgi:DNA-directed RNA polymerase subunit beta'